MTTQQKINCVLRKKRTLILSIITKKGTEAKMIVKLPLIEMTVSVSQFLVLGWTES